jgi:hypothetical protein
VRRSPSGAVEIEGAARDLVGVETGAASLVVVVAREGSGADPRAIALGAAAPRGAYVGRVDVRVVP